jgi:hypothetical protein
LLWLICDTVSNGRGNVNDVRLAELGGMKKPGGGNLRLLIKRVKLLEPFEAQGRLA